MVYRNEDYPLRHIHIPVELELYFPVLQENETLPGYLERFFIHNREPATWVHCCQVARRAVQLAEQYGLDARIALLGGWLHDIATVIPDEHKLTLAARYEIPILPEERKVPYLLHQQLSRRLIEKVFGLKEPQLLSAVGCHTTLRADMEMMDQLLFAADKLSWTSSDTAPYVHQINEAADRSLEEAVQIYLEHVWTDTAGIPVLHPWLIAARLTVQSRQYLRTLPALSADIHWGPVTARFHERIDPAGLDTALISNVSIVPMVGDRLVMIQLEDGRWELPGGTLEKDEPYLDALQREVEEEMGGMLLDYQVFGYFHCESAASLPYRPYIPHPHFIRLAGYGQVRLQGAPLNPPDGEQVARVDVVDIEEAVERLRSTGRSDLADFYRMGYYCWQQQFAAYSRGTEL
ncbi:bis(5'-nucleosyl)-tetraphosphatase (symmetrical) YqeK [Paenibacillus wulumuqiensis]|uniref:bis(5'-nucleosyl)-tetraphosphatase (symmetrical) YqeK n=1 Tax=Paenibacillus wulumuqiensis TaxID=1567107 RepID=UPI00138DD7C6|nr:bis(5'-nucleosyl)-tetraphosphatase (symmetrical) YqeK [Paenibacillus wulumuqiensis]